jgi:hypothetical protein
MDESWQCSSKAAVPAVSDTPATATCSQDPKKGGGTLPRIWKKKREEGPMPLRQGGVQRDKSIMQQAQEQFQGLCRSSDGRAILELGTKQQRTHREALLRGDLHAVERAEQEAEENAREEEQEVEDLEQPTVTNKHMARRYRYRIMHRITSQALRCRKKMTSQMNHSFMSPSGLGCSTQFSTQVSRMSATSLEELSNETVGYV